MLADSREDGDVDWATIEAELAASSAAHALGHTKREQRAQAGPKQSVAPKPARPTTARAQLSATPQVRRDAEALAQLWTEEARAAKAALERKCDLLSKQLAEANRRNASGRVAQQRSSAATKQAAALEHDAARGRALERVAQHGRHALATLPLQLGLSQWRHATTALRAPDFGGLAGARPVQRLARAVAALHDLRLSRSLSAWLGATRGMRQAHELAHGVARAAVRAEREHAARIATAALASAAEKATAARARALDALLGRTARAGAAAALADWRRAAEHARAEAIGRAWSHACGALLLDRSMAHLLGHEPTARCLGAWREAVDALRADESYAAEHASAYYYECDDVDRGASE